MVDIWRCGEEKKEWDLLSVFGLGSISTTTFLAGLVLSGFLLFGLTFFVSFTGFLSTVTLMFLLGMSC